ncbi:MAG: metallophosphoesterase, partial [Candidatus Altiarchaeota archaeon]|nr:metallophosphoesterase [Candidatus Altiarchaeota archaeon]
MKYVKVAAAAVFLTVLVFVSSAYLNGMCTGSEPSGSGFWSIILDTNCSNAEFQASDYGGVNLTSGNTLTLTGVRVSVNNTLFIVGVDSRIVFNDSEVSFTYNPENFTLIILPDTQMYSQDYPNIFTNQTRWIASQVNARNIVFVAGEGDIANTQATWQYQNANNSLSVLDGVVPYAVLPGNHDYNDGGVNYNLFFNASRYSGYGWYGGNYMGYNNSYHFFSAGGSDYMLMSLGFCPNASVVSWANQTLRNYSERKAIIV